MSVRYSPVNPVAGLSGSALYIICNNNLIIKKQHTKIRTKIKRKENVKKKFTTN